MAALALSRKFRYLTQKHSLLYRAISTTSQVADDQIDNSKATKLINYLYVNNKKGGKNASKTVNEAVDIYHKITDAPSAQTIDNLLQFFFNYGQCNQYTSVWNDIKTMHTKTETVSYPCIAIEVLH